MPEVPEVGAFLRELHDAGFSWAQVAEHVGASSGDYARKVAAGVKPGRNLAGNVRELRELGTVSSPAPRRLAASGELARIRAPRGSVERSVRPTAARQRFSDTGRMLHRTPEGRLGFTEKVHAPATEGIGRERAREAIMGSLRSAARGQHKVMFRITGKDGIARELGSKGGYRASTALRGARGEGHDPFAWLAEQMDGRYGIDTGADILAVEILTL